LDNGYHKEAAELVEKLTDVMFHRLSKDPNLWEFYSPNKLWGSHHKTYIWSGIIKPDDKRCGEPELNQGYTLG